MKGTYELCFTFDFWNFKVISVHVIGTAFSGCVTEITETN